MQAIELNVGDQCWCFVGNHKGKLSKGKVVQVLNLDGWSYKHYVIEIPTHVDPILQVRDPFSVSDHSEKPIGLHRKNVSPHPRS